MEFKIENVGEHLKKVRLKSNLKLKEVSDLTGLSSSYISRIENGSSNVTKQTLEKLCKVYSLNIKDIVIYEDLEDTDSEGRIDIAKYISNNEIYFEGEKIFLNDKIAIVTFLKFLTTVEDYTIKESCLNIIKSATNIAIANKKQY